MTESLAERDDLLKRGAKERIEFQEQLNTLQKDRDQALLLAERENQQQLSLAEQEKLSLNERLKRLQEEHHEVTATLERLRKDAEERIERDKQSITALSGELRKAKQQLDDARYPWIREVFML